MNFNRLNNKILTGGAGLLGTEFAIFVSKNGYKVFVLDNNKNKISNLKKSQIIQCKRCLRFNVDITKYNKLKVF